MTRVWASLDAASGTTVSYLNFHTANLLASRPELEGVFRQFDALTPEGVAVIWALRWWGHDASRENILSAEFLVPPLFHEAVKRRTGVYLVGGTPGVAETAARSMRDAFPGLRIVGTHNGQMCSLSEEQAVVDDIRRLGASIVLVGMGQPRQEEWIVANRRQIGPAIIVAIGGYFDKVGTTMDAYPPWVYRRHLFWLYRLATEPSRLWRRYLLGGPRFVFRVLHTTAYCGSRTTER